MYFFLFYLVAILALGQTSLAFNCSDIEKDGIKFDLSSLNKTNKPDPVKRKTPPTITEITYLINPCAPLLYDDKQKSHCDDGTYICELTLNYMNDSDSDPRTISIRPVAGGGEEKLKPEITLGPASNKDDVHGPLSITLHGGSYVDKPQQANITFICDKDEKNKDEITIHEFKDDTLVLDWKTHAACGVKLLEEDKSMSGFTKFVIILLLIILCYFGLGAAYNYHVYKAHGWDLLPHLDFWRDFPYLISDVFKYLVNSIRTGSRTGYNRV